jgi:hypothetical protein
MFQGPNGLGGPNVFQGPSGLGGLGLTRLIMNI